MNKKKSLLILIPILLSGCAAPFIIAGGGTAATVPFKEKGVSGTISDTQINTVIGARLHNKSSKAFTQIDVDVQSGEVLLTGSVDDASFGVDAEQIAWKADGVKAVYNHVQNSSDASLLDYTKDTWITTKIKSKLLTEDNVKSLNYFVKTVGQTVYLMGVAQNDDEMKVIHDVAQNTSGVKKVISYVTLKKNKI
jgi:osmotically-inducible protein OsmY